MFCRIIIFMVCSLILLLEVKLDVVRACSKLGADITTKGLQCLVHLPTYTGLTTFVMSAFDLKLFCSLIQDHKITYTYVAPPVVLHLAKNPAVDDYDLSSLRMITSGAAPLTKELIHAVKKRLGTEVKQAYGLSETSPATHIQVRSSPPSIPISNQ